MTHHPEQTAPLLPLPAPLPLRGDRAVPAFCSWELISQLPTPESGAGTPSHPGVADIRVNHHCNIVAVDTISKMCLTLLLAALTELRGIPVMAVRAVPATFAAAFAFLEVAYNGHGRRRREAVDAFDKPDFDMPDEQFRHHFRLSKERVWWLCDKVADDALQGTLPHAASQTPTAAVQVVWPVWPRTGGEPLAGSCIRCGRTHKGDMKCSIRLCQHVHRWNF